MSADLFLVPARDVDVRLDGLDPAFRAEDGGTTLSPGGAEWSIRRKGASVWVAWDDEPDPDDARHLYGRIPPHGDIHVELDGTFAEAGTRFVLAVVGRILRATGGTAYVGFAPLARRLGVRDDEPVPAARLLALIDDVLR
jgi:hypothetical protein